MVLGNREFLIGGAGAAGPALEGGISRSGMRARDGAVDTVTIRDGALCVTVIGGGSRRGSADPALWTCWPDAAGRLDGPAGDPAAGEEQPDPSGGRAVGGGLRHGRRECLRGGAGFTQTDIRQFTETKAAAHTMVAVLLRSRAWRSLHWMPSIWPELSGASGSGIRHCHRALSRPAAGEVPHVGNSSLQGACDLLAGRISPEDADALAGRIYYLEFAMQETFVEQMRAASFYPHTDLGQYPTVARRLPGARH